VIVADSIFILFSFESIFLFGFEVSENGVSVFLYSKSHCLYDQVVGRKSRLTCRERIGISMKKIDVLARVLTIVGALNWGLVGVFQFDLVAAIVGRRFGEISPISSAVYILVGLAAVYEALSWKAIERRKNYSPARA
jgi:hypothetical protein